MAAILMTIGQSNVQVNQLILEINTPLRKADNNLSLLVYIQ